MIEIPLTRGLVALVDDADVPLLSTYTWHAHQGRSSKIWYANSSGEGVPRRQVKMHRLLMPGVRRVDHRDGNGLNNQRANLRPCTDSQNQANRAKYGGTSRYKGVHWLDRDQRWHAEIMRDRRTIRLGRFVCEDDAAKAYNAAALELFGEFARLNIIEAPHAGRRHE